MAQSFLSNCETSWRDTYVPSSDTADMMRTSIGEYFIAQQGDPLGSLDASSNDAVIRVSETILAEFVLVLSL